MSLRILYAGVPGGTSQQRADALEDLGHHVRRVMFGVPGPTLLRQVHLLGDRLGRPPDFSGVNRSILEHFLRTRYDCLWVDKGRWLRRRTLSRIRATHPRVVSVSYSPDDMMNPTNQSVHYLACVPLYHLHVTTKSYNVGELKQLGAKDVLFIDNAFDPATHRPLSLTPEERRQYEAGVGFVGAFEEERAEYMRRLAQGGIRVRVWGPGWERFGRSQANLEVTPGFLDGLEFTKAINATRINLGFLRKINRDLQTTRSVEIPACGAFMLAERTAEHTRLFDEGKEAEFFDCFEELLSKCRYYLEHEEERSRIAEAGWKRCVDGGYSNQDRLRSVIAHLESHYLAERGDRCER
jgi:hypothetical protein